jgi:biotin carboxyl carrier protein
MRLKLRLDGREVDLNLERDGEWQRFELDGNPPRTASLIEVKPGVYSVLLDGRSLEARVDPGDKQLFVEIQGRRYEVEAVDPRRGQRRSKGAEREGRQQLTSPMPGKVVRLLVSEGDQVEAGQGLVVVEAMKMQNEMKAPKPGRVVSLSAREGARVAAGEVLAVIE